ncbi:hypothetical protein L0664_09375 [Octadecabacter sp. G9-8]|uniref:Lipoprotein n=1 Tax=Octadecabacter dasysiphoniae TaxID=2909341 RepID=A0ABS9CWE6_9RHOB|nr:hypothetical protein [Octadecabacter dasysiphoniae]MCF2871271.1 hypothetical protein [Octadecabacter dasysiphoniae]
MRYLIGLTSLLVLGACTTADWTTFRGQIEDHDLLAETRRTIDSSYRDLPFESGAVYVVANEHGELHTYSLTPCGGTHICGANGHVGHVERTLDYFVVTGAYRGRTFFLSPGGDGYLTWRGENRDLAWN